MYSCVSFHTHPVHSTTPVEHHTLLVLLNSEETKTSVCEHTQCRFHSSEQLCFLDYSPHSPGPEFSFLWAALLSTCQEQQGLNTVDASAIPACKCLNKIGSPRLVYLNAWFSRGLLRKIRRRDLVGLGVSLFEERCTWDGI